MRSIKVYIFLTIFMLMYSFGLAYALDLNNMNYLDTTSSQIRVNYPTRIGDLEVYVLNATTNETIAESDYIISKMGIVYPKEFISMLTDYDISIKRSLNAGEKYRIYYTTYDDSYHLLDSIMFIPIILIGIRKRLMAGFLGLVLSYVSFGMLPLGFMIVYVALTFSFILIGVLEKVFS